MIEIEYIRPPGRMTLFRQQLVIRTPACTVTLLEHADLEAPVRARGHTVLEPGAPVVWFTFPGLWHDIGRFHTAAGRFTGYYANVLTPVRNVMADRWRTTDLFLDVWLDDVGAVLLDEEELAAAEAARHVTPEQALRARDEARSIMRAAEEGTWPPRICREYTIERVRRELHDAGGTTGGPAV
jgi:predicted RNA-binding protein associated with RNAse of E/G family